MFDVLRRQLIEIIHKPIKIFFNLKIIILIFIIFLKNTFSCSKTIDDLLKSKFSIGYIEQQQICFICEQFFLHLAAAWEILYQCLLDF
jgi:hypothetical protein